MPEHPRPAARFPVAAHSHPGRWLGMGDPRATVRTAPAHYGHVADVSAWRVVRKAVTMMQQGIDKWDREQPAEVDAYMQCLG